MNEDEQRPPPIQYNADPLKSLCGQLAHQINMEKSCRRQLEHVRSPEQREHLQLGAMVAHERAIQIREALDTMKQELAARKSLARARKDATHSGETKPGQG